MVLTCTYFSGNLHEHSIHILIYVMPLKHRSFSKYFTDGVNPLYSSNKDPLASWQGMHTRGTTEQHF